MKRLVSEGADMEFCMSEAEIAIPIVAMVREC